MAAAALRADGDLRLSALVRCPSKQEASECVFRSWHAQNGFRYVSVVPYHRWHGVRGQVLTNLVARPQVHAGLAGQERAVDRGELLELAVHDVRHLVHAGGGGYAKSRCILRDSKQASTVLNDNLNARQANC